MTRETIGLTAYRLTFSDGTVVEMASVALIDILMRCNGYKPLQVCVLDRTSKEVGQKTIDFLWNKIHNRVPALH